MGFILSKISSRFFSKKAIRVLMVGMGGAGKTSVLYRMTAGVLVDTNPTIGFNLEYAEYKKTRFELWDTRGQDRLTSILGCYYQNTKALIFVVDSVDLESLSLASKNFEDLLSVKELSGIPILIMANKQDVSGALSPTEIADTLCLSKIQNRKWFLQGTSAVTGEGLKEGMEWLANALAK